LGNFSLAMALLAGLNHPTVTSLTKTWESVDIATLKSKLDALRAISVPAAGYQALRASMTLWKKPCIPYFGVFLDRMYAIQKSWEDLIVENDISMINFDKFRKLQGTRFLNLFFPRPSPNISIRYCD